MGVKTGQTMWEAPAGRKKQSEMQKFAEFCSGQTGQDLLSWDRLYRWSVESTGTFWELTSRFTGIIWIKEPGSFYLPPPTKAMTGARWFAGGLLNFAQNLLEVGGEREEALICYQEEHCTTRLSREELKKQVSALASSLRKSGIKKGDRIAGVLANGPEAVVAMLATASLGAVFSSCSPDFGAEGICDRFLQIEPKIIFFTLNYRYNGKIIDCRPTLKECQNRFPDHTRFIVCGGKAEGFQEFREFSDEAEIFLPFAYEAVPFDHPLYIMFSSGTTGKPKAIIHGTGGTLLQHKKELLLHTDLKKSDCLLYFTTCGWMMWNWMLSALSLGSTVITYDGSPCWPDARTLWELTDREKITALGTSPKFLSACMSQGTVPRQEFRLESLKTVLSTGSPLLPEHFEWVYEKVKQDVHLASISGGTDIISCFMLGNPLLPVKAGEIQAPGLGMKIETWDQKASPVRGEKGELVCTSPFVSMPVGFYNDPGDRKYQKAYFERFKGHGVWHHGDFIEITDSGGIIVYGRSDATLNPGGVRIGTSEIYRQAELCSFVADSLAAGLRKNGDVEVVLFVKLRDQKESDIPEGWQEYLKKHIRKTLTPRHVPAHILPVLDIPYTRSGKKVEVAVTRVLHGEPLDNTEALSNPESLLEYKELAKLLMG